MKRLLFAAASSVLGGVALAVLMVLAAAANDADLEQDEHDDVNAAQYPYFGGAA